MVLENLKIEKYREFSNKFEKDVYDAIDLKNCVKERKVEGGPSPIQVMKHIKIRELNQFNMTG